MNQFNLRPVEISTSKWPSEPQFCHVVGKNIARNGSKTAIYKLQIWKWSSLIKFQFIYGAPFITFSVSKMEFLEWALNYKFWEGLSWSISHSEDLGCGASNFKSPSRNSRCLRTFRNWTTFNGVPKYLQESKIQGALQTK